MQISTTTKIHSTNKLSLFRKTQIRFFKALQSQLIKTKKNLKTNMKQKYMEIKITTNETTKQSLILETQLLQSQKSLLASKLNVIQNMLLFLKEQMDNNKSFLDYIKYNTPLFEKLELYDLATKTQFDISELYKLFAIVQQNDGTLFIGQITSVFENKVEVMYDKKPTLFSNKHILDTHTSLQFLENKLKEFSEAIAKGFVQDLEQEAYSTLTHHRLLLLLKVEEWVKREELLNKAKGDFSQKIKIDNKEQKIKDIEKKHKEELHNITKLQYAIARQQKKEDEMYQHIFDTFFKSN